MSNIRKLINLVENVQHIKEDSYTIKKGNNLSTIARRNGITLDALLDANPDIKDPNKIKIGQKIEIPNPTPVTGDSEGKFRPSKGQTMTSFAKSLGFDDVEEFIQAQENLGGGKIGVMKSGKYKGNKFVYADQDYVGKVTTSDANAGIQQRMKQPFTTDQPVSVGFNAPPAGVTAADPGSPNTPKALDPIQSTDIDSATSPVPPSIDMPSDVDMGQDIQMPNVPKMKMQGLSFKDLLNRHPGSGKNTPLPQDFLDKNANITVPDQSRDPEPKITADPSQAKIDKILNPNSTYMKPTTSATGTFNPQGDLAVDKMYKKNKGKGLPSISKYMK
jgi:LysM repeat protein